MIKIRTLIAFKMGEWPGEEVRGNFPEWMRNIPYLDCVMGKYMYQNLFS